MLGACWRFCLYTNIANAIGSCGANAIRGLDSDSVLSDMHFEVVDFDMNSTKRKIGLCMLFGNEIRKWSEYRMRS